MPSPVSFGPFILRFAAFSNEDETAPSDAARVVFVCVCVYVCVCVVRKITSKSLDRPSCLFAPPPRPEKKSYNSGLAGA